MKTLENACGACGQFFTTKEADSENLHLAIYCDAFDFGSYYFNAITSASKEQGTEAISEALTKAGIPNIVEQTGGFCMVVFVYSKNHKKAIMINSTGLAFSPDLEDYDNEIELTPSDFVGDEYEGCNPEVCAQLVELVKKNLHLLN